MKKLLKLTLIALALAASFSAPKASAQGTIVWDGGNYFFPGFPPDNGAFDILGDPVTSSFTFNFGTFLNGFTPTASNITSWNTNWFSLDTDQLTGSLPDTIGGSVNPSNPITNGLYGFMWVYDALGFTGSEGGQAFLGTGTTSDWLLPSTLVDPPLPANTVGFDNMTSVIYGRVDADTPAYFGVGGGSVTNPLSTGAFDAQLAAVPEPSGALLIGCVGMLSLLRRRRLSSR